MSESNSKSGEAKKKVNEVRNSGPHEMKDKPVRKWEKEDEESDQSFPASDPPANY